MYVHAWLVRWKFPLFKEIGHISFSLFFFLEKEIFSDQTFLIVNTELKSSATLSPSLQIYASTTYIAGIYTLSFSSILPFLLTDYMYIAIIISWGTLCTTRLRQSRALTQRNKTGDPPNELYVSTGINRARNTQKYLVSRINMIETHQTNYLQWKWFTSTKVTVIAYFLRRVENFLTSLSAIELYTTGCCHWHFSHDSIPCYWQKEKQEQESVQEISKVARNVLS